MSVIDQAESSDSRLKLKSKWTIIADLFNLLSSISLNVALVVTSVLICIV